MMEEDPENRIDPMSRIFPRVTKCIFTKFGPGGGIIRRDALCVLPVNIINEVGLTLSDSQCRYLCSLFTENLCVPLVLASNSDGSYR